MKKHGETRERGRRAESATFELVVGQAPDGAAGKVVPDEGQLLLGVPDAGEERLSHGGGRRSY